jgi:hypothetical protein
LAKLAAVVPMIGVSLVHDFLVEPAGGCMAPGSPAAARLRRLAAWLAAWLARGNALTRVAVASAVHLAGGYGAPQAFAR